MWRRTRRGVLLADVFEHPATLLLRVRKSRAAAVEVGFPAGAAPLAQSRCALLSACLGRRAIRVRSCERADLPAALPVAPPRMGPVIASRWAGDAGDVPAAILERSQHAILLLHAHGIDRHVAGAAARRARPWVPRPFLRTNEWLEEIALVALSRAIGPGARVFLGAHALVEGRQNEIDVLVQRGARAVAIECKAFRRPSGGLVALGRKLLRMRVPPLPSQRLMHCASIVRVVGFVPALTAGTARPPAPAARAGFEPHAAVVATLDELANAVCAAL